MQYIIMLMLLVISIHIVCTPVTSADVEFNTRFSSLMYSVLLVHLGCLVWPNNPFLSFSSTAAPKLFFIFFVFF